MPKVNQPTLYVIAGPNGASKSTSSSIVLQPFGLTAFDWDHEFYSAWKTFGYDPLVMDGIRESTSELFRNSFQLAMDNKQNFAFETNFHVKDHIDWIYRAKDYGFNIHMIFFYMPTIEECIERVAIRRKHGGHSVPTEEIRLRYKSGLQNLKDHYILFDSIMLFDTSLYYDLLLVAEIEEDEILYLNKDYKHLHNLIKLIPALKR